jgi:SagB-type dehydrogenase family enzyme
MKNDEITAAWKYHDRTKHSYSSIRSHPHHLDWDNHPIPFKIYTDLPSIALPQHLGSSGISALSAISTTANPEPASPKLTTQLVAEILFLTAGITKRRSYPGGEMLFRAAACTGALYHIDLYIVCGDLGDLAAGVYHFSPQDFSLRSLRRGDFRPVVMAASGDEPSIGNAPCVIVSASTFWRNAWKYQSRAYRHCYWDNGTILANLLAASAARQVPAKIVIGFVETAVNDLLGLDERREAALSLVALGHSSSTKPKDSLTLTRLELKTAPLSKTEVDYPLIRQMHHASSLESAEQVGAWREEAKRDTRTSKQEVAPEQRLFPLDLLNDNVLPQDTIEDVIVRRGSTREFSREAISFTQLSTMIDRATRGIPMDFLGQAEESLNDVYLIVNAVEGLPLGAYAFRRRLRALELLREGDFRGEAGYLGLGQAIPRDASANIYFLTDLASALKRMGNRGYRAAQLEAATMGGKIYLAAYAQRLGASGLTFFDDDVTEFFSPDAAGKSVMFLIAVGKSVKKPDLAVI